MFYISNQTKIEFKNEKMSLVKIKNTKVKIYDNKLYIIIDILDNNQKIGIYSYNCSEKEINSVTNFECFQYIEQI